MEPRREHQVLRHVRASELSPATAQSPGMSRREAVSGATVGSERLWMGETRVAPGSRSADHHHGESETAIFVVAGHPAFVFLEDGVERRIETSPGDFVYVPPFVPHREENPGDGEALIVLARTTQEAIVVNLPGLQPNEAPGSAEAGEPPGPKALEDTAPA